jgi:mannose-6-phosphate isomerase
MKDNLSQRAHRVGLNCPPVYYAGGGRIASFRGLKGTVGGPEDWVGSTTALPSTLLNAADPTAGITRLEDGTLLSDAVKKDPTGWLGPELGSQLRDGEVGLLVKLLDAGERLPVHCHPSRAAARGLLGCRFGKTEGWVVMAAAPGSVVWLGFNRDLKRADLLKMIAESDTEAMLACMNRVEVTPGDIIYVPAGVPHAIDAGVFVTELQEPTSFSVLAEYQPFGLTADQATLGLGWETAVSCFELRRYPLDEGGTLVSKPERLSSDDGGSVERLFPPEADEFFRAYRVAVRRQASLSLAGYRVVVVTAGALELEHENGAQTSSVRQGETWLLPWALGELGVSGQGEMIVALPPLSAP